MIVVAPIWAVAQALSNARPSNERIIRLATRPSSWAPLSDRIQAVDEVSVHGHKHFVGPAGTVCGAAPVDADGLRAGGNRGVAQQDGCVQSHDLTRGHEGMVVVVAGNTVGAAATVERVRVLILGSGGGGVDGILVAKPVSTLAKVFVRWSWG